MTIMKTVALSSSRGVYGAWHGIFQIFQIDVAEYTRSRPLKPLETVVLRSCMGPATSGVEIAKAEY